MPKSKRAQLEKSQYLKIYSLAHNNARDLLKEARLLFNHKHFARAYALAITSLEEISKSQFAADVYTGLEKPEDFEMFYKNHGKKLDRVKWAYHDASSYPHNQKWVGPDRDDVEIVSPKEPTFKKRQIALFVDVGFDSSEIIYPEKEMNEEDAGGIIHIVETALDRIWEVTEYWGHQIGTKGFMK
jgi:AbiV family abortive infection protein